MDDNYTGRPANGTFWSFSRPNPNWSAIERIWYSAMLLSYIAEQRAA